MGSRIISAANTVIFFIFHFLQLDQVKGGLQTYGRVKTELYILHTSFPVVAIFIEPTLCQLQDSIIKKVRAEHFTEVFL